MDFSLSSEQTALADSVRRWAERDYSFDARRATVDSPSGISDTAWGTFAELGWLGAGLSEEAGGFGGGAVENALIAEGLGRALVVEPFIANAVLTLQTLVALGESALIESIVMGERKIALGHHETAGRGDPSHVETRAANSVLNGTKSLVLGAPSADALLVSARDEHGNGLYLVTLDAAGLTRHDYRLLDNSRVADLTLIDVQGERIGSGDALPAIFLGLDHATVTLCAEAVGAMDTALWMTRDYLKTRQQFGQPIGNFQGLQFRMADMLVELELARSMVYQGLAALSLRDPRERQRGVAAAKAMIGEAGLLIGRQAIQLHGGIGMTEEYAIGHYYKRLFVIAHLFGNSDAQVERFVALS